MINWKNYFSESAKSTRHSEIRQLLKIINKKDVISLAGGIPDPHAFPKAGISHNHVFCDETHVLHALLFYAQKFPQ